MEITTSPHRPAPTPWGRLVALVVIVAPVSVLVLLPIGLGLERYVMSGGSMDAGPHGIARGSVLFEREVPVSDLEVGDVITYRPPRSADSDAKVTHRIVSIGRDGIVTKGDAETGADPWVLRPERPTLPRVTFTLPWIGYAYLILFGPGVWTVLAVGGVVLALLLASELSRRRELERQPEHDADLPIDQAVDHASHQAVDQVDDQAHDHRLEQWLQRPADAADTLRLARPLQTRGGQQ